MSTSEMGTEGFRSTSTTGPSAVSGITGPLHRLRVVRRGQRISLRRVAQQLNESVEVLRVEEDENSDLLLSRLYAWQRVLEVPVEDLLVDTNAPLSAPVLERARMIRLMKTVATILEKADSSRVRRLAQTLVNQLVEIMPELEGVTPWNMADHGCSLREYSRIIERCEPETTSKKVKAR